MLTHLKRGQVSDNRAWLRRANAATIMKQLLYDFPKFILSYGLPDWKGSFLRRSSWHVCQFDFFTLKWFIRIKRSPKFAEASMFVLWSSMFIKCGISGHKRVKNASLGQTTPVTMATMTTTTAGTPSTNPNPQSHKVKNGVQGPMSQVFGALLERETHGNIAASQSAKILKTCQ